MNKIMEMAKEIQHLQQITGGQGNTTPPANNGGGQGNTTPPANNGGGQGNTTPPANNGGGQGNTTPPANNGGGQGKYDSTQRPQNQILAVMQERPLLIMDNKKIL